MVSLHELEWTDEELEAFWSFYGDRVHMYFAESFGSAIVRSMSSHLSSNAVCIDFGCGTGGLTRALLDAGYRVGACDRHERSVMRVRQRFDGGARFLGAWISPAAAPAHIPAADAVFSIETIEHVMDRHAEAYFAAIAKLLKPGGIAIFTTPNNEDIEAAKVFCPESGALFHPMQHVRRFDRTSLPAFLREHGFETTETFVTDFGLSLAKRPKAWIADKGKRALGMGTPPPHLGAVTRLR